MAIGALSTVLAAQVYDGTILSLCLPVVIAITSSVLSYLFTDTRRQLARISHQLMRGTMLMVSVIGISYQPPIDYWCSRRPYR